jgi:molybdenum cofactor synthesis domain-containing protein
MTEEKIITAAIIIIGNEILSGRTQEANMLWLSKELKQMGILLRECAIVRDDEEAIISAVHRLKGENNYVFTSGGIGPTHDDITTETVGKAFKTPVTMHPEAEAILRAYYETDQQTDARMKMAKIPEGASLIPNPVSAAPGFILENVHVMAGVPRIFQAMFQQIRPTLTGGPIAKTFSITAFAREGDIAEPLEKLQKAHPQIEIGSYPFLRDDRFGAQVVFTGTDDAELKAIIDETLQMLKASGVEYNWEA